MNKRGLTLIEVIVSALVLAVAVGGVLYVFSTEQAVIARTGRRVQAMDFARQTLEELKNDVGADTWPTAGPLAPGGPTAVDISSGDFKDKFTGTREYTVTNIDVDGDTDVDYKSVSVTVNWDEPAESQ